jgi:amino-acid N-acetyltransferase
VDDAALVPRTREQVQQKIRDFFVLEMDGNPIGSVAVHDYVESGTKIAEIACLFVKRSHKNKGHGQKLVTYAEDTARKRGCARICALSTQAFRFFEEKLGYQESDVSSLPKSRREKHDQSGRNSKVLTKNL